MFKPFVARDLSFGEDLSFVLPDRCQIELFAVSIADVNVYGRRAEDGRLLLLMRNPAGTQRVRLEGFNLLSVRSSKAITCRLEIADRPVHERGVSDEVHIAIPLPASPLQRLRAAMTQSIMDERYTILDGERSPYEVDDDDYLFEEDFIEEAKAQAGASETTGIERAKAGKGKQQPESELDGEDG